MFKSRTPPVISANNAAIRAIHQILINLVEAHNSLNMGAGLVVRATNFRTDFFKVSIMMVAYSTSLGCDIMGGFMKDNLMNGFIGRSVKKLFGELDLKGYITPIHNSAKSSR
jgi:hypothetical protein